MKVPLKWLEEYIDIDLPPADLANRLTMAGSEVKGMQIIGDNWENIVVGQITAINPHPNADRLSLTTVDLATEQPTVVCGAPNLRLGDRIAFAHVGAQLIDPHNRKLFRLKSAKIRGVVSSGMVCSEKEMGISESHEGIMVLPADAPIGTPLAKYMGDVILDLDVTPNRPDCLSIIGIARELAALTKQSVHLPEVSYKESTLPIEQQIAVDIVAPDLCPRYCATLITGVKIGESPPWMQQRLLACGMRPISNIVDITNYVMLEYGQPLHAFDYEKIRGKKIIVRRATPGEVIISLDGVERILSKDMLVIADVERAVAIAGIMGGLNSEVTDETTTILLEAANFNPVSIRTTGQDLGLPSEACMRFERGIRAELTLPAIKQATQLMIEIAGGEAASGVADVYPGKLERKPISLSTSQVNHLLDTEYSLTEIEDTLTSLSFDCKVGGSDSEILVTAPYWRSDINQAVDLIEEVARIIGYDTIPTTMLSQPIPRQNPDLLINLKRMVSRTLIGYGLQEVVSYSLTGPDTLNKLLPEPHPVEPEPIRLANPMTTEQGYLRPNLRANLLYALMENRKHEDSSIRLFEVGRVYLPKAKDLPDERESLCGILSGPSLGKWWRGGEEPLDFFDAKGVIEGLLSQLGVEATFKEGEDESLHPTKQAVIVIDGKQLGIVGEVHTKVVEAFEITEAVYLFEIDLTALLSSIAGHKMFQPTSRFPAVVRDMSLVVNAEITHQKILDIIKGFPLVKQVTIFDVYEGEQVPPGKKSLAYRIVFQSPTHTLTDEEVDGVQQQILDKLSKELGATLRS